MLKDKIKNVYIMGGSEFLGNVTRVAEFNIYADPEAASVVFQTLGSPEWAANTKTTVFGWNLCIQSPIPWPRFDQIIYEDNSPNKIRQFLSAISMKPYPPLSVRPEDKKRGGNGAVICDALVMVAALYPHLILETEKVHVEVELCGEMTRGQTILDYGHCYDGIERPKLIDWVTKVDTEAYISLLEILVKGSV
jgi:inosine-uridine nucleoside N-ribohydrolase